MKNLTHAQNRHYPIMEQNCLTQSSLYDRVLNMSCYLKLGVFASKTPNVQNANDLRPQRRTFASFSGRPLSNMHCDSISITLQRSNYKMQM